MIGLLYDEDVKSEDLRELVIRAVVERREDEDAKEFIRHLCLALKHLEHLEKGEEDCDRNTHRGLYALLFEEEALKAWCEGYERENPGQMEGDNLGMTWYPECLPHIPRLDKKTLFHIARVCGAKDKARLDCMRRMIEKKSNG